ncbi:MAG: Panacea domain-containing protein [Desulfobulbaceae bacterium]
MIITHHKEKLINAAIYFAKNTKYCGKIKLMKLLYFLDFLHFRETGRNVTGQKYFAWEHGPVPVDFYKDLSKDKLPEKLSSSLRITKIDTFHKIVPIIKFDKKYFSERELRIMSMLAEGFKDLKAQEMIDGTHMANKPWGKTLHEKGEMAEIDYMLAVDEKSKSLTKKEALERLHDREELFEMFGTD